MNKSELRERYLEKRLALTPEEMAALNAAVAERFFGSVDLATARFIHCYLPIQKFNEPNTILIIERVWSDLPHITTTVPRVDFASGELESVVYSSACPIVRNRWDITEPEGGRIVPPERIDLAIVPLVCFDHRGHRVGYGKGFYDRFLGRCRPDCLKVGLSFFPPVDGIADAHDGDIPLDLCVMPDGIWRA